MEPQKTLILNFLINLPAFLIALVIHEYAHGYVASKFGDNTAKFMGRLTFNPLAHIDPFGTIFLPLFMILSHSPIIFGWAKPVPVNFFNLRNPRKNMVWVGLAGPLANFIAAALIIILINSGIVTQAFAINFLSNVLIINLILGVFNLIPVPPLDGSRILMGLLPERLAILYSRIEPYGIIILIAILLLFRYF